MDDFGRLLEQELPSLRRYARALVSDLSRSEDLVQDCLERALRKAHLWRPGTNLRAWLFTLLHNLHANSARRFNTVPKHVSLDDTVYTPSVAPNQAEGFDLGRLQAALGRLPEEQRQVVNEDR